MQAIETELRQYIIDNFVFDGNIEFSDTDSFLDLGLIDSTGILELIGFLEEHYSLELQDGDLVPENLDSISNIAAFVRSRRDSARCTSMVEGESA